MKLRVLCGWAVLLLWMSGCNGWDDDSEYAVETRAAFFLAPTADGLTLLELRDGDLSPGINALAGLSNNVLSAAALVDNVLWISGGSREAIFALDPETKTPLEEFSGLPLQPHHFAVGREQLIATDTVNGRIAFVRLRNGEVTSLEFEGKPGLSIYSNGRFYTQVNDSLVYVYDEKAFTPRAKLNIGAAIVEFQLDRFNNVHVLSRSDSSLFSAIIASNADYISRENFPVDYQKMRYSPYFSQRYTTEYLTDLQLIGGLIQTPQASPVLDPGADNFEVNFFAGVLHYFRNDSLFRYDLHRAVPLDSMPFPYAVLQGWYQLSEVN